MKHSKLGVLRERDGWLQKEDDSTKCGANLSCPLV